MHLLHRSYMSDGGSAPLRASSSPKAPPPRHQLFSKSDSIKKRSATDTAKKSGARESRRARLRAGLAAALQEFRLAIGCHKRGPSVPAGATQTQLGSGVQAAFRATDAAAAGPPCASASSSPEGAAATGGSGAVLLLLLAMLGLLCVVALGRAPAVCWYTCAAWWCRGPSATSTG